MQDSSESADPSFNPNESIDDEQEKSLFQEHIEEWICVLPREDLMSLVYQAATTKK